MKPSYRIKTLADLYDVPANRRTVMFKDLERCMALTELAVGDEAKNYSNGIMWIDDGCEDVALADPTGTSWLSAKITKAAP